MQHIVSKTAIDNKLYKLEKLWSLTPDHLYLATQLPGYTRKSVKAGTLGPIAIAVHPPLIAPKAYPPTQNTKLYPYDGVIGQVTAYAQTAQDASTATDKGAATIISEKPRISEFLRLIVGVRRADGAKHSESYIKSMAGTMSPYYKSKSVSVLKDITLADTDDNKIVPSYDTPDYDAILLAAAGTSADNDVDKLAFESEINNYGTALAPAGTTTDEVKRAATAKIHIDTIRQWDTCRTALNC